MINHYKRNDIFKCMHLSHKRFGNRVSVYHVLKVKNCFPNGCISFEGVCRLLNKGQNCVKGYNYAGANCTRCSYFKEQKIIRNPEILLQKDEYENFLDDLDCFEEWIERNRGRFLQFRGTISWIKPSFEKKIYRKNTATILKGFIIGFKNSFIDIERFDDYTYALFTGNEQDRLALSRGDEIEFSGKFDMDNGMIMFYNHKQLEIITRAYQFEPPTSSQAKVALAVSKILTKKDEKCTDCPSGSLIYIKDFTGNKLKQFRRFICAEGYENAEVCERISYSVCEYNEPKSMQNAYYRNKKML